MLYIIRVANSGKKFYYELMVLVANGQRVAKSPGGNGTMRARVRPAELLVFMSSAAVIRTNLRIRVRPAADDKKNVIERVNERIK